MNIGLNLLHALPEIGGGWNYIANLVAALGECDHRNTYMAYVTNVSECLVPKRPGFSSKRIGIRPACRPQRILYENTLLHIWALRHKLDCMHWFANTQAVMNSVPGVVTVYDLHAFMNLAHFPWAKRMYARTMMTITAKRSRVLLPMSQATALDFRHLFKPSTPHIVVIPPIVGACFKPAMYEDISRFRTKYGLPPHFWLYVAHMYPHKNHLRLLEAYQGLKSTGFSPWPIVLRGDAKGAEAQVEATITNLGLQRDVFLLPRLQETELPALYSAATAMIFPSLYEGGGMPVIEAMACGCPIAVSDIPPVRENAGDAAIYFDPTDLNSIQQAIKMFQSDNGVREWKSQAGLIQAELFRAELVVKQLLRAYSLATIL